MRGPAAARGRPALSASRPFAVLSVLLSLSACREPPAREMRRIQGVHVEIRAVGLPRPAEPALGAAFAGITAIDGASTDWAVATLRAAGARKGLVNLGGDLVAVFGEPLVVAVPDPRDVARPRWASFRLHAAALGRATAADGATGTLAVTAVAKSASEAATLAAAALPLTPAEAVALLGRGGASGFVQVREGDKRVILTTAGFGAARDLRAEAGVLVRP